MTTYIVHTAKAVLVERLRNTCTFTQKSLCCSSFPYCILSVRRSVEPTMHCYRLEILCYFYNLLSCFYGLFRLGHSLLAAYAGVFRGIIGNSSRIRDFPLLFNVFFAAILLVAHLQGHSCRSWHIFKKSSRRRLLLKRLWNVHGVLFGGCYMPTTHKLCRGRHVSWSG